MKYKNQLHAIGFICAVLVISGLILVVGVVSNAFASEPHHSHSYENTVTEQTIVTDNCHFDAMAGASGGHQFHWGNEKWKWSADINHISDCSAISGAFGKRFGSTITTFSITADHELKEQMFNFSIGGDF